MRFLRRIGKRVGIRYENVVGIFIIPALGVPFVVIVQHLLPLFVGQIGARSGLFFVRDPNRLPRRKIERHVARGRNSRIFFRQRQRKHRSGVGHENASFLVPRTACVRPADRKHPQKPCADGKDEHKARRQRSPFDKSVFLFWRLIGVQHVFVFYFAEQIEKLLCFHLVALLP